MLITRSGTTPDGRLYGQIPGSRTDQESYRDYARSDIL
jgi:hypothetical protein